MDLKHQCGQKMTLKVEDVKRLSEVGLRTIAENLMDGNEDQLLYSDCAKWVKTRLAVVCKGWIKPREIDYWMKKRMEKKSWKNTNARSRSSLSTLPWKRPFDRQKTECFGKRLLPTSFERSPNSRFRRMDLRIRRKFMSHVPECTTLNRRSIDCVDQHLGSDKISLDHYRPWHRWVLC